MTATDGGNAVFAGAKNCPCHRAIACTDVGTWNLSGTKFLTTHMDVGNADFAGAKISRSS